MSRNLVDTNLIIRFLLDDDPKKSSRVEKLLKNKGNLNFILDTVIAEIVWVLGSYYELSKADIIEKISALIHIETVECNNLLISKSLRVWEENNISYIDAYLAAAAEMGQLTVYSYDKKFKSISNIAVKEP